MAANTSRPALISPSRHSIQRDLADLQKQVDEGNHFVDLKLLHSDKEAVLLAAIVQKKVDVMELLLVNGVSPDFSPDMIAAHGDRRPVGEAIKTNDLHVIETLLHYGADVDYSKRQRGYNLAIVDAIREVKDEQLRFKVVQLLLHCRTSQVNEYGIDYSLPLDDAITVRDVNTCKLLIENNADFEYMSHEWLGNALCNSIVYNLPEVAQLLLDKGTDPDITDGDESPAIYIAIKANKPDMLKVLLNHKYEPNDLGYMLQVIVWQEGTCEMSKMVIEHLKVDLKSDLMAKTLIDAMDADRLDLFKCLLKMGIDLNFSMNDQTPLQYAFAKRGGKEYVKALIKHNTLSLANRRPVYLGDADVIESHKWSELYFSSCWNELERMKKMKFRVDYETTYFDAMMRCDSKMVKSLRDVDPTLLSKSFISKLRIKNYAEELLENSSKIMIRVAKINKFNSLMEEVFAGIFPSEIIWMISEYYNDADFSTCIQ